MKKSGSLLLVSALLFSVTSFADIDIQGYKIKSDNFTLKTYGKLNLTLQLNDLSKNGSGTSLESETDIQGNASRLGFRGWLGTSDKYRVIYQAEWGINGTTDGQPGRKDITTRDTYIGISTPWGDVLAGAIDSPTKKAQQKVDLFNDVTGDISAVLSAENRLENLFLYKSPMWKNAWIHVAAVHDVRNDKERGISANIGYIKNGLYGGVGWDNNVKGLSVKRLVGSYEISSFTVGAMLQRSKVRSTGESENGHLVSLAYKPDEKNSFSIQYTDSSQRFDDGMQSSIGYSRQLSPVLKLFTFYTYRNGDEEDRDARALAAGFDIKF